MGSKSSVVAYTDEQVVKLVDIDNEVAKIVSGCTDSQISLYVVPSLYSRLDQAKMVSMDDIDTLLRRLGKMGDFKHIIGLVITAQYQAGELGSVRCYHRLLEALLLYIERSDVGSDLEDSMELDQLIDGIVLSIKTHGHQVDIETYNRLLEIYAAIGASAKAVETLDSMRLSLVRPNTDTYMATFAILTADQSSRLMSEIKAQNTSGYKSGPNTYNLLKQGLDDAMFGGPNDNNKT
eukprot:gene19914-23866_t